jgi:hypothetical protein
MFEARSLHSFKSGQGRLAHNLRRMDHTGVCQLWTAVGAWYSSHLQDLTHSEMRDIKHICRSQTQASQSLFAAYRYQQTH